MDVNLTDGQQHGLELYFLDWDTSSRAEQVQISDAATGAVLSTQSISSFHNGLYLDYTVSGNILITITKTGGANAVLSGLFLDPSSVPATPATIATVRPASESPSTAIDGGISGPSALAIGALDFSADNTGSPSAGGMSSTPGGVVRIRWRR